jgi:hypothetical protein
MAKIVHTEVEVVPVSFGDNRGVLIDTEKVIKNINDVFEREDIKQLNVLLLEGNKNSQKDGA